MVTIGDIEIFLMSHNRADLVSESIESLLNQTADVREITVLDNDSTDNTEEVVLSFSQRGVKYKKTTGFLGNFNFAHENACKEYVMLFHDDDILHPEYLEKVLEILNKEKKIAAVYSRYTEFWNKNSPKSLLGLKTTIQNVGGVLPIQGFQRICNLHVLQGSHRVCNRRVQDRFLQAHSA